MGALTSLTSPPDTPCPRQADDLAWLLYTSSPTDHSKALMLSHGNLTAMSQAVRPRSLRSTPMRPWCMPRRCRTAPDFTA
ncbi:hypothetical protein QNM99_24740 [Pseudomonas sp. PCH446]